jgi:hypothetical protein
MRVSRRMFLGAAGVVPVLAKVDRLRPRCVVLDLGCVLPESFAGFKTQVGDLPYGDGDGDVVIVPAVRTLTEVGQDMIDGWLEHGATVLLEYVAGARVEQRDYFPYVEYVWPVRVKIREFEPVELTPGPGDEIIATFSGQPVGLRRRTGDGVLITLGSPLGPVFLAGDPDARRWLNELK